jgi:hypothetical protein
VKRRGIDILVVVGRGAGREVSWDIKEMGCVWLTWLELRCVEVAISLS